MSDEQRRFATYAWWTLGFTVLVILWGAVVRATGSGAGCGSHWPLCNGEIVPASPVTETIIEFGHRLTSGIDLLLVVGLVWGAWRTYPRQHLVRKAALVSLLLIVIEALLGAGLVLLEYVADDTRLARGWWVGGHLLNTYILLAALTFTAYFASGGPSLRWRHREVLGWMLAAAMALIAFLGMSGALTALGDTLFPAETLRAAKELTFSPESHLFVRLRVWHPVLAVVAGLWLAATAWHASIEREDPRVSRLAVWLVSLYLVQLGVGIVNVWMLAPVGIQVVHLLLADLIWILLLLLVAEALRQDRSAATTDHG